MPAEPTFRLRRPSRLIMAVVLGALLVLVPSLGAASATTYPPDPEIDVDKPVVVEGTIVTISGSGFAPNSVVCLCILGGPAGFAQAVSFSLDRVTTQDQAADAIATCIAAGGIVIGLVTTDENGDWEFQWDTADFPPGDYIIGATDGGPILTIEVDVTDPGPDPTTSTTQPTTTTTEPGPTTTEPGPTTTEAPPVPTTAAPGPGPGPGPGPSPTVAPVKPLGPSLPQTGGVDHQLLRIGAITLAIGALTLLAVRGRRPASSAS